MPGLEGGEVLATDSGGLTYLGICKVGGCGRSRDGERPWEEFRELGGGTAALGSSERNSCYGSFR